MTFSIPLEAIEDEDFKIEKPGNQFALLMLWINLKNWKSTFTPIQTIDATKVGELHSEDPHYFWTLVSDNCQYFEPGIQYESSIQTISEIVKMDKSWAEIPWSPIWEPISFDEDVVTVEFENSSPQQVVFVGCEICTWEQRSYGDCAHYSSGGYGSWVSVDFELPNKSDVDNFIQDIANQTKLGSLSESAQDFLSSGFQIPESYFRS